MKRLIIPVIIVAFIAVCFSNCNKTNSVSPAVLRVFNADPSIKPQDLYLNGNIRIAGLKYGGDTNYTAILPGTYNIKFAPASTSVFNTDYNIDFSAGKNYMMFLVNINNSMRSEVFDENFLRLGIDTAEFRFLDFSPNAPLLNVAIKSDTASYDTTYTIFTNRFFNDAYANRAYAQFRRITSGPYNVKLQYLVQTDSVTYRAVTFDSIPVNFLPGKSYTIYTRGYYDSSGVPPLVIDTLHHN